MDAQILIDPASAGIPAPIWFVQFFKWLGFTLHIVPMNLWYAGLLVALCLRVRGNQHARHFATRLLQQMPVLVALGINFGIVPLLFVQLSYYKVFYPATILMAWFWMAIIGLLILAYYGVYAYAWGLRNGTNGMTRWRFIAGWCATAFFIAIGFLFANGLSLMDHVDRWPQLWNDHSIAGASLGTALNLRDPTLFPRWLLMFCLALGTTAVWLLVDAFFLSNKSADKEYRAWAIGFAKNLYVFATFWGAIVGSWYVFGTWSTDLRASMFEWPLMGLTVLTALAPGLPLLLIITLEWSSEKHATVAAIAFCQFGVLGINAASRQVVQNLNLKPFVDVLAQPTDIQWGPLAMFLIVFVIGMAVVAWMVAQIVKCDKPAPR